VDAKAVGIDGDPNLAGIMLDDIPIDRPRMEGLVKITSFPSSGAVIVLDRPEGGPSRSSL
jgi:hypothetical protein